MDWLSRKAIMAAFLSLCLLTFGAPSAISQEAVTLVGEVTSDLQFVTSEGAVYEIGESEQGDLLTEQVGFEIEVKGNVLDDAGTKILIVKSFRKL